MILIRKTKAASLRAAFYLSSDENQTSPSLIAFNTASVLEFT
jgi:hypothetical protein